MDAHGRGRADEIDPADQWVFNPQTGNYELRLDSSAPQPSVSRPRGSTAQAPPAGTRTRTKAPAVPGPRRGEAGGEGGGRRGRKRAPERSGKKKALLVTGGSVAFLLVVGSVAGYLYLKHLDDNITTIDTGGAGSGGFKQDQAINILVIGTDKRTGAGNAGYGDKNSAGHADTTILFHVAKDRSNATALSIPRDLITDIPDCPTVQEDGTTQTIPGTRQTRFNESLGQAGRDPGCTMRTVQELTGLQVDHFMMADFNAVKTLSTAVGGVPICLAKDVDDRQSKLKLPKGEHRLEGEQALAFVRTRKAFGNRSDLGRIQTQQMFLSSMIREMKSKDTLTSPKKLLSLAEAATQALTVDKGIGGLTKLMGLASELKGVNPKNVTFLTLPVRDNPAERVPVTVVIDDALAQPLLAMLRSDTSLTEVAKSKKEAKDKQEALLDGTRAPASEVRVDVYNGGGPQGSASSTLLWLQNSQNVAKSSNLGNAPVKVDKTVLEYGADQADQARALADMMGLPAQALKPAATDAPEGTPMKLTLGGDFKAAGVPINAPKKVPEGVQRVGADEVKCAQ
ncbi:LCP family protein [Streptomyces sp. NPDC006879]|uniref:LCP family protein n=1 Tax=Streptomyces sp. NPDC006879 TaxID=3364767 RepID=UPI00368A270E